MPPTTTKTSFRGDTRDEKTLKSHGGFVPQYLLKAHDGGLDGFKACTNKSPGQMGCRCGNFSEMELYTTARKKFIEMIEKPIDVQAHVIFNTGGFISTANAHDDAYGGHQYRISAQLYDFSIAEAGKEFKVTQKLNDLVRDWHVYTDSTNISTATLLAITPRGGVELTYVSPIDYKFLSYTGEV